MLGELHCSKTCPCDYLCAQFVAKIWTNFEIPQHPEASESPPSVCLNVTLTASYDIFMWCFGCSGLAYKRSHARVSSNPTGSSALHKGVMYYRTRASALALAVSREREHASVCL